MRNLRGLYRLLLFASSASLLICYILLLSLVSGTDIRRFMRLRQRWLLWLLPRLGVRLHLKGTPPDFPCIIMGNHRSYLDPVAMSAVVLAYPVSKAEVSNWPIIGYGSRISGVLYLKRESRGSRKRTLSGIAEKLREGYPIILFPEGTSHSEPTTITFKPGSFLLAAEAGFPVVPIAVEYRSPQDYWVGKDTFLPHFLRRFGEKEMHVYLHFGPKIESADGLEMLAKARAWVDAELQDIQAGFIGQRQ